MPLKRIEECSLDDLFGLFEIEELTLDELKIAKKKVLLLHPDKNVGRDTKSYYAYFKNAYDKLESIHDFIHRPQAKAGARNYQMEELEQKGLYEYCQKKGLKDDAFRKVFNEAFQNVYIPEEDGHGEWLKTEGGIYDGKDLEGSRKKAMALAVIDKDIRTLQEIDNRDIKEVYEQSVLPIDVEKVLQETAHFKTVQEYQIHRAKNTPEPLNEEKSVRVLKEKDSEEYKTSIQLSYELLKRSESHKSKMKDYYSKFLRLES
jgi:hypothetical protein